MHQHDAFGSLAATKDALQNSITRKVSIRGFKVEMNDPDAGLWNHDYDALDQSTTMAYDKLGRLTSRTERKVEYWHMDHLGSLIATTDHAGAVTARYAYDRFGKRRYTNASYDAFWGDRGGLRCGRQLRHRSGVYRA